MLHLDKISVKSAVRYTAITAGACGVILAGAFFLGNEKEVENGMGGNTYPAFQSVMVDGDVSVAAEEARVELVSFDGPVDTDALSYMSYRIKKGDMIGKIAEQFSVTQDSIISVNNIRNSRTIQVGEYLKIPTKPGILYTVKKAGETIESIAKEKSIDAQKCMDANGIAVGFALKEGQTIFLPDAKLSWSELQEINGDLFRKPIRASWYKSSSFGWRSNPFTGSRSYHSGVDMACPTGTSVYAAMAGKVIETGYNATYGNYVILQHTSGYKTLYGHLSAIKTKRGAYVNQDTIIGKVGSTGMSTGPHLHFTVFKNGKLVNPVALWN